MDILTNNGHDREIVNRLRKGETHQEIASWLLTDPHIKDHVGAEPDSQKHILDVVKRVEIHYHDHQSPVLETNFPRKWTTVTRSPSVLRHLFNLYFTWVHPVHMLFSENDFKESYWREDSRYCSGPLVNAICAMACHLLDHQGPDARSLDIDAGQLREAFLTETRSDLSKEPHFVMTSVQAFAVMYLADLSSGKARSATAYLRCAADQLQGVDKEQCSPEAFEISRWGIQTLNT